MKKLAVGEKYVAAFGEDTEDPGEHEFVVLKELPGFGEFAVAYKVKWVLGLKGKVYQYKEGSDSPWGPRPAFCIPYAFDESCGGDEFDLKD